MEEHVLTTRGLTIISLFGGFLGDSGWNAWNVENYVVYLSFSLQWVCTTAVPIKIEQQWNLKGFDENLIQKKSCCGTWWFCTKCCITFLEPMLGVWEAPGNYCPEGREVPEIVPAVLTLLLISCSLHDAHKCRWSEWFLWRCCSFHRKYMIWCSCLNGEEVKSSTRDHLVQFTTVLLVKWLCWPVLDPWPTFTNMSAFLK